MNYSRKIESNFIINLISVIISIALGIIIPRLTLTSFGSEINGLVNSVSQVYAYFTLFEAGVAATTLQALYGTVAKNDRDATNAVLSATNRSYKRTGLLYFASVLLFAIVYPLILKTDVPHKTIRLIILVNGLGAVIQYFFQAKYFILLQAEGKNYIRVTLTMVTNLLRNIAKIVLMRLGFGIVLVQSISLFVTVIHMTYTSWYIKKHYDWIDLSVPPNYSALSQSKNSLVHQVSELVFNNTDILILTAFCGLKTVSVYSLYKLLFDMVKQFLDIVPGSVVFAMGQVFNTDKKKFGEIYEAFETYYLTLLFSIYTVARVFITPFLKLYTVGVNDISYIDRYLPTLFVLTYFLSGGRTAPSQPVGFAGHFKLTQWRAIAETAINLIVSLIAVQYLGIHGVLLGTVAAMLFRTNDLIIYSNRKVLHRNPLLSYRRWFVNIGIYCCLAALSNRLMPEINSYPMLFTVCVPFTIGTLVVFLGIISLVEKKVFFNTLEYLRLYFRKRGSKNV